RLSNKSISSLRGTSSRIFATGTSQCANSKSCQFCAMIHGPLGSAHGRCSTNFNEGCILCSNIPAARFPESNPLDSKRLKFLANGELTMQRKASAVWQGDLKSGKGTLSTDSSVLKQTAYSFHSRFESGIGTNPEELLAAAHAGCFTMALSAQ